jgi:hypothetical protein
LLALGLASAVSGCRCDNEPVIVQTVVLSARPAALDLGDVPVLAQTEATVVVENTGNAAWQPSSSPTTTGAGFRWLSGCDAPVAPNGTCSARVRFAPTQQAPHEGTLAFAPAVDGEDPLVVSLSGTGTEPTIVLDPPLLDFGDVLVGQAPARVVRLENRGTVDGAVPLVIDGGFHFADGTRAARVDVAAGDAVAVDVVFAPSTNGDARGALRATICGPSCGPAVELTGRATAPRVDVQPRSLDLGVVPVGSSTTATLVVTNRGDAPLDVTELAVVGDAGLSLQAPPIPQTVAPGASFDVIVTWSPAQGTLAVDGAIAFRSSDPVGPQVFVPVTGTAPGAGLDVRPPSGHLGFLDPDEERDLSIVARAVGDAPVTIDGIRLIGDPGAFFLVGAPSSVTLAPGESLQFFVRGRADAGAVAAGGASASVVVQSSALGERVVDVTFAAGTSGCVPRPVVAHVALGAVRLGEQSGGDAVIENVGDAPCTLLSVEPGDAIGLPVDATIAFTPRGLRTLPPGAAGTVQFAFLPDDEDAASAVAVVTFVEAAAPVLVSASGRGVRGGLVAVPTTVSLGPVLQGCSTATSGFLLFNDGGATVEVRGIGVTPASGPIDLSPLPLPFTLSPGESLHVPVVANTSVAPGVYEAVIDATSTAGTVSVRASLTVVSGDVPVTERFVAADVDAVDILFIVDNSASMQDDQDLLAQNFSSFFATALADRDVDFRIGVTTTDVVSPGASAGRLVGPVLDRFTPDLESAFAEQVRVGDTGSGIELGLEALRLALEDPDQQDLIRDDAALSVVFVTDEEDTGAFPEALPDPSLAREPAEYVALLEARKGAALTNLPVLVSAVITPGFAERYEELVDHFGGTSLDITSPSWGAQLGEIGVDTFSLARAFVLADEAAAGSIVVEVDGRQTTAFSYDAARHAVILDQAPRGGAEIVVTYQSGCS